MLDVQLFDAQLIRMTFVIGIGVSVLMYERTHTTTGSLVVPGYIGAQLLDPVALIATAINAGLTYLLVSRVLPRFAAVYGRARFVVNILVSVVLSLVLGPVLGFATGPTLPVLTTIGYVIPALIAYDMNRQGPKRTAVAVMVSGSLAAIPALLIVLLAPQVVEATLPVDSGLLPVGDVWFPVVALISTGVSASLHANHRLRSGGFIGPMYLGLAVIHPWNVVFFIVVAIAIYLVVEYALKPNIILFGRRKFAVVLMLGSVLSWLLIELAEQLSPGMLGIAGLPVAALFIPALLANDMERTSVNTVLVGGFIAAGATLSITVVLAGTVDQETLPIWALPLLIWSLGILFWPRLRALMPTGAEISTLPLKERASFVDVVFTVEGGLTKPAKDIIEGQTLVGRLAKDGDTFYAVVLDGTDLITGEEIYRWHEVGQEKERAVRMLSDHVQRASEEQAFEPPAAMNRESS